MNFDAAAEISAFFGLIWMAIDPVVLMLTSAVERRTCRSGPTPRSNSLWIGVLRGLIFTS